MTHSGLGHRENMHDTLRSRTYREDAVSIVTSKSHLMSTANQSTTAFQKMPIKILTSLQRTFHSHDVLVMRVTSVRVPPLELEQLIE